jgi:hypothetical protein
VTDGPGGAATAAAPTAGSTAPTAAPTVTASESTAPVAPIARLPIIPWADLAFRRHLGKGAFGDVALMAWARRGLTVAVKCNGTTCANGDAIDNERRLYELLLSNPHENIVPVYAICTDAPDGKVRLVMRFCEKGSLDSHLTERARHEVGPSHAPCMDWVVPVGAAPTEPQAVPVSIMMWSTSPLLPLLLGLAALLLPRVA